MTRRYSSNAIATTLAANCTNSATSIQVTATTGFPAVDFVLALDYGTAEQELVLVTGVAGTTLTVTRGYDSTTAQAHTLGAAVRHVHAAIDFRESRTHEEATSGVHGATGALVGTTGAQALTNKDLSSATNTFPSSLATDAEVTSAVSTHAALTATHGATGAVVGTTNTQTLTNKDLSSGTNTFPSSLATDAELSAHTAAASGVHGITGAVVGTTDTQMLTNKTLASPTITGTGHAGTVRKTADQVVNNSTTLQDDLHLSFTPDANSIYRVRLTLAWTNAEDAGVTRNGFKAAFSFAGGANSGVLLTEATGTAESTRIAGGGTVLQSSTPGTAMVGNFDRELTLATGASTGLVKLQWAQRQTDTATTTTLKSDSTLSFRKIGTQPDGKFV